MSRSFDIADKKDNTLVKKGKCTFITLLSEAPYELTSETGEKNEIPSYHGVGFSDEHRLG